MNNRREMEDFEVSYTKKDLILYALSLGMGSSIDDKNELKFLYEQHDKFTAVPTFALALTFWADKKNSGTNNFQGIPSFPPPLMASEEVLPIRFLRKNDNGNIIDILNLPVIHTWQSIVWHQSLKIPTGINKDQVKTKINLETISVQPKSIGTFVTSQTKIKYGEDNANNNQRLCTIQGTVLVLGVDPKYVATFDSRIQQLASKPKIPSSSFKKPIFEWIFQSSQSQALLYRMTSGDSNHIHVDNSASDMLGSDTKAPLLHGLFTLALVYRAVIKLIDGGCNSFDIGDDFNVIFRRLEGKFKAPAYVGDCLCVKIWNGMKAADTKNFVFVVTNHVTGQTLLDCGYAEVAIISQLLSTKKSRM
mmetsp:Transcript_44744/g.50168  ORF Transcript_44744/g.50168 Transcript_44744/m.50168 type:complete len:362 (-) Transcript_44744:47-1132(-)